MANFLLCTILLLTTYNSLTEATSCHYDPLTCLCSFQDEVVIDLKDLVPTKLTVVNGNLSYDFSGCRNLADKCGQQEASLCLSDKSTNVTKYTVLGIATKMDLVASKAKLSSFDIYYQDSKAIISLICSPSLLEPKLLVSSTDKNALVLFSQHGCVVIPHHGLSTGSRLLIMFFVFVLLYFVIGALVMYFMRGARGLEIIPNIDFWRGLPSLVRDGSLFLLNGCNPVAVPTAETYDRI